MNVIYVQNILQILKIFKQLWSSIQHDKQGFEYTKWIIRIVNRRRTDNTMAKKKKDKRTNNELRNIHTKLKIE
jgi:hypothetical protein